MMISVNDLHYAHPGRGELFGGLQLHIHATDSILLRGDNGCGKSTLLRLLVGLLEPHRGSVTIGGNTVRGLQPSLFSKVFYQSQSTTDNLLGITAKDDWDIWKIALPHLPDLESGDEPLFTEMSSGMLKQCSQRILPYVMDKFWILDEPFAALDSVATGKLTRLLQTKSQSHPGMLIVSHGFGEDYGIYNRIWELNHGNITEVSH